MSSIKGFYFAALAFASSLWQGACVSQVQETPNSSIRRSCWFACQYIPPDSEVLQSWGHASVKATRPSSVTVLVWNLYKGRMAKFAETFAKLAQGKDLILLSEVVTDERVKPELTRDPDYVWNFAASFVMNNGAATGVAIGSRAEGFDVGFFRTVDLEPFVKSPKAIVYEKVHLGHADLLLVSIHGINWAGNEALQRQLDGIWPVLQQHKGPILFAGDFNFKNKTRLSATTARLQTLGLERISWDNESHAKALDNAFLRGLKIKKAHIHPEVVDMGSDHPALELELSED